MKSVKFHTFENDQNLSRPPHPSVKFHTFLLFRRSLSTRYSEKKISRLVSSNSVELALKIPSCVGRDLQLYICAVVISCIFVWNIIDVMVFCKYDTP